MIPVSNNAPFFIVGCVRSGTTMLRDILRRHPDFACPEETHFFRWAEPYGAPLYAKTLLNNPVLKRHRELDGITEAEFATMLKNQTSRANLCKRYMALYMQRNKPNARRWFDKTPQNVYGAPQIAMTVEQSKFIHIVRDPVQVAASLRIGKIVKVEDLVGACNYWNEAINTMTVMKRAFPRRVLELRYEDFVREPIAGLRNIFEFLNEPFDASVFKGVTTRLVTHDEEVLDADDLRRVQRLCLPGRLRHGYAVQEHADSGSPDADADEFAQ
jgi:hypothetical protein